MQAQQGEGRGGEAAEDPERRVLSTLLAVGGGGLLLALCLLLAIGGEQPVDLVVLSVVGVGLLALGQATWQRRVGTRAAYRGLALGGSVLLFVWQASALLASGAAVGPALLTVAGLAPFVFILAFLGWEADRALLVCGGFLAATLSLPVVLVVSSAVPNPGVKPFFDFFLRYGVGQSLMIGLVLLFARNRAQVVDAAYQLGVLGQLARTDTLTGVLNRRGLVQAIGIEAERNLDQPCRLALIFIDLDHFKRVNDRWGHPGGDEVLMEFADVLRRQVRTSDVVGRWGGEEFVVLMRRPTTGEALFMADRLRRSVERHEFPVAGRITASFGVAELRPGEEISGVITAADEALYRAKTGGRNRTCASRGLMERMESGAESVG